MRCEDRPELFLVWDRDPDDDAANCVDVHDSLSEAKRWWPNSSYPITRAVRGEFDQKKQFFNYDDVERVR